MDVLRVRDVDRRELTRLLACYELQLELVAAETLIPGSYWGETEAGLVGEVLHARSDTPVHSVLHETAHFVCMTPKRRSRLHRDAGGDDDEESAVCYLQVLLSDFVSGLSRSRLFQDMDSWGYSFRLGSTESWFRDDATDALLWLKQYGLLGEDEAPNWKLRGESLPLACPFPQDERDLPARFQSPNRRQA